jgi:hypothetical protein
VDGEALGLEDEQEIFDAWTHAYFTNSIVILLSSF